MIFKPTTLLLFTSCLMASACTADLNETDPGPTEPQVLLGEADVQMRGLLIQRQGFNADPLVDPQGATARFSFFPPQSLPPDERPRVELGNGEFCTYEILTEYPESLDGEVQWPSQKLTGGDVTIDVESGPGDILLDEFEQFYFSEQPGSLVAGDTTHSSFFDSSYLPAGENYSASFSESADVGSLTFDSTVPDDFSIISPDFSDSSIVIDVAKEYTVRWTPGQSDTTMVVLLRTGFPYFKCDLKDDGEATISAEAMSQLVGGEFTPMNVMFWREKRVKTQVYDSRDKIVEVDMVTRTNRYGTVRETIDSSAANNSF